MKKTIYDIVLYFVAFVAIQILAGAVAELVAPLAGVKADHPVALTITSAAASLLTIIAFLCLKWAPVGKSYIQSRPWATLAWSVVAALGVVIPSAWLQEMIPELPDTAGDSIMKIIHTKGGYFVVCLLAPMVEEIVFRGAILRRLFDTSMNKWGAICITAALFALVHANPAQTPHAFLMGWLMGWLYMRTGSIIPAIAFHWANNTVAYFIAIMYPGKDTKLVDIFSGNGNAVLMAVVFSLCIFIPAIIQLNIWTKKKGR